MIGYTVVKYECICGAPAEKRIEKGEEDRPDCAWEHRCSRPDCSTNDRRAMGLEERAAFERWRRDCHTGSVSK